MGHAHELGWRRTLSTGVLLGAAAIAVITLLGATGSEKLGYDFRAGYLPAAEAIRDGESPYATVDDSTSAGLLPYVYPPQLAIALVPLTFLPVDVASFLAFVGALGALMGALAVVGVRDARCYAAVLVWAPGWNSLEMANVSSLLALGVALAWRFRSNPWILAACVGLTVSTKLFLWPLLLWTAVRRIAVAVVAFGIGVAVSLASWGMIGFAGLASYPHSLSRVDFGSSYSVFAIAEELGFGPRVGRIVTVVVGGALLGLCALYARRGDDLRSFASAIASALVLTPVVWQHYLVLLAVPLAVARPRFSPIWLVPLVLWVSPRAANGDVIQTMLPAAVAAILVTFVLVQPHVRRSIPEAV